MGDFFVVNTSGDLFMAVAVVCVVIALGFAIRKIALTHLRILVGQTQNKFDDIPIVALETLGWRFYTGLAILVALETTVNFPETVSGIITAAFVLFLATYFIILSIRVIDALAQIYLENLSDDQKQVATLIPSVKLLLKIVVTIFVVIFAFSNIGINVTALLAGLGIGGLAIAFASQKILADLFSAFVIFFDKPFTVGDFIVTDDIKGTIEKVGLKTTQIRAFSGEKIMVTNESLVNANVHNLADVSFRKLTTTVPVAYGTSQAELDLVVKIVQEVISKQKNARPSVVSVAEFGEHAIMFEVAFKVMGATFDEAMQIRHKVHLDILDALEKADIELGYPIEIGLRRGK